MKIAFVIYPDFTALDLVGPYEVISRWPGAEVHFVSSATDPVRCDSGLTVLPTDTPSFDSGSLEKASPKTRRLAKKIMLGDRPMRAAASFGREMMRARIRRARGARVAV